MNISSETESKPLIEKSNFWQKLFQAFRSLPPDDPQMTARDVSELNNHLRADIGLPPVHEQADWRKHL